MLTTTFQLLRKHEACEDRYKHLRDELRRRGHSGRIPLSLILETNGLDDALWSLRAVPQSQRAERDRISRLFASDCAERVLPTYEAAHPGDNRVCDSIAVSRRHAVGEATDEELSAAKLAAWSAAADAWSAAHAAAWSAAWSAAELAAQSAARSAERAWQAERLRWYLEGGEGK